MPTCGRIGLGGEVQQDHHGLVAEIFAPRGLGQVLASGLLATLSSGMLGALLVAGLQLVLVGLLPGSSWLLASALLWLIAGVTPLVLGARVTRELASQTLQRVTVKLSTDTLTVEVRRPLQRRGVLRMALPSVRSVRVIQGDDLVDWLLVLGVEEMGRLEIPCRSQADAQEIAEHLKTAIARAPAPASPVPPPQELLAVLQARREERQ
jgi:hypothetical protein